MRQNQDLETKGWHLLTDDGEKIEIGPPTLCNHLLIGFKPGEAEQVSCLQPAGHDGDHVWNNSVMQIDWKED